MLRLSCIDVISASRGAISFARSAHDGIMKHTRDTDGNRGAAKKDSQMYKFMRHSALMARTKLDGCSQSQPLRPNDGITHVHHLLLAIRQMKFFRPASLDFTGVWIAAGADGDVYRVDDVPSVDAP